jgi:hypothetical protein
MKSFLTISHGRNATDSDKHCQAGLACSPFIFGVKIGSWFLEGLGKKNWFEDISGRANLHDSILESIRRVKKLSFIYMNYFRIFVKISITFHIIGKVNYQ